MRSATMTKSSDMFQNLPSHFQFSETASSMINSECANWRECIATLMDRQCFTDAMKLLAFNLSPNECIVWGQWCLDNLAAETNAQFVTPKANANSPTVWLEAAEFWNNQFDATAESHLSDLAQEAIYTAVSLVVLSSFLSVEKASSFAINKGLKMLSASN